MIRNRKHIRLKNFDYRSNYRHFITICTKNRECFFGENKEDKIILSEIGMMAERFWLEIPDHFHHVVLDKYIIMPNHIHGIIKMDYSKTGNLDEDLLNSETCAIGTFHGMSLLNRNKRVYNKFGRPLSGSISVIINQYKSSLKRWCNKNDYRSFAWQTRFYDHIINNRGELYRIRDYIESDPVRQNRNKNIL